MRVALVFPRASRKFEFQSGEVLLEPLGLMYLSAMLREQGHETIILDQTVDGTPDKDIIKAIKQFNPQAIGFSLVYINVEKGLELAQALKTQLPVPTIAGYIYPTSHPEIVQHPGIDLAVLGEGENTLVELVERIDQDLDWRGVPGTSWLENGQTKIAPPRDRIANLDSVPFPDRRFFDPLKMRVRLMCPVFKNGSRIGSLVTSRGCGMRCGFCSSPIMWGGQWIGRSPENVISELQSLRAEHGINKVMFNEEEINYDRDRSLALYGGIQEAGLDMIWMAASSVRQTDLVVAEAMVNAGMRSLFIGFETGAPEILEKFGKQYKRTDAVRLVQYLQKHNIFVTGSFILGLPWESRETVRQTIEFAKQLNIDLYTAHFHRPDKDTAYYKLSKREGLFVDDNYDEIRSDVRKPSVRSFHLSSKEIEKAMGSFYLSVLFRPRYILRIAWRILCDPPRMGAYLLLVRIIFTHAFSGISQKLKHAAKSSKQNPQEQI